MTGPEKDSPRLAAPGADREGRIGSGSGCKGAGVAPGRRFAAAGGALACAVAVGLGAYAMHAATSPQARMRLAIAALFLFMHGMAVALLAPNLRSRPGVAGLGLLGAGTVLFAGSLVGAAVMGVEPRLAPFGGSTLIVGWILVAAGFLRG